MDGEQRKVAPGVQTEASRWDGTQGKVAHMVQSKLHQYMDIKLTDPVIEELRYEINLYGVSFLLDVRWDDPFYRFELKHDISDQRIRAHDEPVDYFNNDALDRLLENVRAYAKLTTQYSSWQVALNDAFTNAGFLWLNTEQFERRLNFLHVLLSKNGVNCYFELHFRAGAHIKNYYELLNTMKRSIPRSRTDFGPNLPTYASIVETISGVFRYLARPGSNADAPQAPRSGSNADAPQAPRPGSNAPQGSSSGQKVQMQLYEMIVDILIWARQHGTEARANGIAELLRDIKDTLPRG